MKNFIYFTDSHIRLSSPRLRTDDIFEAQLEKLRWIGNLAEELGSDMIVSGGDLGDAWDWKYSTVNKIATIFRGYPCPVISILGNHDVPGKNNSLWMDTGVGALDQHSSSNFYLMRPGINNLGVLYYSPFLFVPFHSDNIETESLISGSLDIQSYLNRGDLNHWNESKLKIAVVHAPVGAEATPYCRGHKELMITDFDFALFGDIHEGWAPYHSITGCVIANPGSMTRLNKKDVYREPKVAIIWEDGKIEYKVIPHSKPKDCFDLASIEDKNLELGRGFLAAIAARNETAESDPKAYVERVGLAAGYTREAIDQLKGEL